MTIRAPVLNYALPLLVLLPVTLAMKVQPWQLWLLSISIFIFFTFLRIKVLECKLKITKLILIFLGIFSAIQIPEKEESYNESFVDREICALIEIYPTFQNKKGWGLLKAKILKTTKNIDYLRNKIIYLRLTNVRNGNFKNKRDTFKVCGIIKSDSNRDVIIDVRRAVGPIYKSSTIKSLERNKVDFDHKIYNSKLTSNAKAFITAFLTGDKTFFSREERSLYQSTGTMHLFAVSGLHFGILYLILRFVVKKFHFPIVFCKLIIFFALLYYLGFVGGTPSSLRAFMMILILEICILCQRKINLLNGLTLAVIFSLFINPFTLFDVGFQLSFTIVLVLIWALKNDSFSGEQLNIKKISITSFKSSLAAFIGSSLILLGAFGQLSPVSILANTLIVPLVIPLMCFCLFYTIVLILFELDFYLFFNLIHSGIEFLLLTLNSIPLRLSPIELQFNHYLFLFLPVLIIIFFNVNWSFTRKILLCSIAQTIIVSPYFLGLL